MHSMHQVQTMHNQHLQQQQQQDLSSPSSSQQQLKEQQLNMTVLESLEPAQPTQQQQQQASQLQQQSQMLGALEPVQQIMLQQQTVIHHLVPAPAPLLHQLQPSNRQLIEQQQQLELEQQQQQQQQQLATRDESGSSGQQGQPQVGANQRQRLAQIEGLAADGGGPIVQWLLENYEIADGESLPRSTVYNHYLAHCRQLRLSSVNAASFGKLIRSVFLGLKTRRLGTRGHSKYHYFGVRAKHHVHLDWLHEVNGSEGRPGCSSAAMLRDSNDTNSNGSDGNCGSETDSTGNCSGRLSTSMNGHNNNNNVYTNGDHNLNGTNKRLKRTATNGAVQADYQRLQQGPLDPQQGNNLEDLDHQHSSLHHQAHNLHNNHHHLHPNQEHHPAHNQLQPNLQQQQPYGHVDHSATNGTYSSAYPMNGYDKPDSFACVQDERGAPQWSTLSQYDLANFRNHLGPNKSTLVDENWPEREPGLLERQLNGQGVIKRASAQDNQEGQSVAPTQVNEIDLGQLVEPFESQYKFYYKRMVDLLGDLQFNEIEHLWSEFWHPPARSAETLHWTTGDMTHQQQPLPYQNDPQQQQQQSTHLVHATNLLTFEQLYELTSQPAVIERVTQIDYKLNSAIESFLMVDMLSPLPRPLVQQLRSFARNICIWTEAAVKDYHPSFVLEKMRSTRAFERALRRYTSINHLSTASRAIWNKRSALVQMSMDLSKLDLSDIEHQVASLINQEKLTGMGDSTNGHSCCGGKINTEEHKLLQSSDLQRQQQQEAAQHDGVGSSQKVEKEASERSPASNNIQSGDDNIENNYDSHNTNKDNDNNGCQARPSDVVSHLNQFSPIQPAQLVQNFLCLLEDPYPANAWPDWCRTLVESRVCGQSFEEARNFILKWNLYISLIMRELTLRSAPSLGSLQLIRLLFDEYMYYLVVSKLAQAHEKASSSARLLRSSAKFATI